MNKADERLLDEDYREFTLPLTCREDRQSAKWVYFDGGTTELTFEPTDGEGPGNRKLFMITPGEMSLSGLQCYMDGRISKMYIVYRKHWNIKDWCTHD